MNQALANLTTPSLLLEAGVMQRNINRLKDRMDRLGVPLRPHLKTCKSVEIAQLMIDPRTSSATVSTLREAEVFAEAGLRDIIYAVGISPDKLERVARIRRTGCDLSVILDSEEQARAVAGYAKQHGIDIPALIEIDCDGHRSGVAPSDELLLTTLAQTLTKGGCTLKGVLTHAGESYLADNPADLRAAAENERAAAVNAASVLRANGHACPVVSVGSTPTAHFAAQLDGVTEVRAGNYVFFDLFMTGVGVCRKEDIALSVLTIVVGHQLEKGWILVDAGWMAMSRDRGTANQKVDQGYGLVCTKNGLLIPDLVMTGANQEHGILAMRNSEAGPLPELPVGTRLRILPNHACSTAAQFDDYQVIFPDNSLKTWKRFRGW